MILDIIDTDFVLIEGNVAIDAVGKSQLTFWGFKYDYNLKKYSIRLEQQIFLKVTAYFKKEDIEFQMSEKAVEYSQRIEVTATNFDNLKKVAADYKDGKFDKLSFDEFREFVAGNIKRVLKIHQLKAAYHLYLLGNGANFSVPGSGKTTVVLTVYEKLRLQGKVNTLFVVGPPSSFGPWRTEFSETLGRRPHCTILAGGDKTSRKSNYYRVGDQRSELYLISFQTLLSDKSEVTEFLKQRGVDVFFTVDEAHYIKQLQGSWASAILQQSELAKFRCVLTGTPMPKGYSDLFNLFDFLWPHRHPISSPEKIQLKVYEERGEVSAAIDILDREIGPLFYRVRKSDLGLKPQNFIKPYLIDMQTYEGKVYQAVFKKIRDYSQREFFQNLDFINTLRKGRIMRLRQLVSYTKLIGTAIDDYDERLLDDLGDLKNIVRKYDTLEVPGKLKFLITLIKKLRSQNQKVVIWSNFVATINLIERHLKQQGFFCKTIYGNTPIEGTALSEEMTRERIRDQFVDPDSGLDILVANPAACAESISLHKTCHHAVYYDLSYNCAQYLQSLDRIHRVGGSETIGANYHFFQYKNSIDQDIKRNIDNKTEKMIRIIETDYSIYSLNMFDDDGDLEAYNRLFVKKK